MKFKGFTLIELLVVISIISLLSSVVLASVKDVRTKAQQKAFRQEIGQFINALELYKNDHGAYPGEGELEYYYSRHGNLSSALTTDNAQDFETLMRPYMSTLPSPKIKASTEIFRYWIRGDVDGEGSPSDPVYLRCYGDKSQPGYLIMVYTQYSGFEDWPGYVFSNNQAANTDAYCFSLK